MEDIFPLPISLLQVRRSRSIEIIFSVFGLDNECDDPSTHSRNDLECKRDLIFLNSLKMKTIYFKFFSICLFRELKKSKESILE